MPNSRLGICEVCNKNDAKYCCPDCELKTCSLPCINIHKKELNCDGIRNRVKFKQIKLFTNMDLQNDYRLLEEIGRSVDKYSKDRRVHVNNNNQHELPPHLYKLRGAAARRHVELQFLPRHFNRHKNNTSFLNFKTQELFWRMEWIFPHADDAKYINERVIDTELLGNVLDQYMNTMNNSDKKLQFYHAAGYPGILVLLKAEKVPGERYYEMDKTSTLRENLSNKVIVEFPIFYVILNHHKQCYDIITPDEEDELIEQYKERLNNLQTNPLKRKFDNRSFNKKSGFKNNFLFPVDEDCDGIDESVNNISLQSNNSEANHDNRLNDISSTSQNKDRSGGSVNIPFYDNL